MKPKLSIYFGIFMISCATLSLEIALTRIFSVKLWYHFTFMVISIALLGFGASGTFLSIFRGILERKREDLLFYTSFAFSLSVIFSFGISNAIPFDPFKLSWDSLQLAYIAAYYIALGFPFFLSGSCLAIALSKIQRIERVYFSDLLGASFGALIPIFLFSLGGEKVIVSVAILGALSCLFFSLDQKKYVFFALLLLFFQAFMLLNSHLLEIKISPYKDLNQALRYPDSKILETRWNSFSRVDLVESSMVRYAPGLSLKYQEPLPPQLGVTTDASNINAITLFKGVEGMEFLNYLPQALVYEISGPERVLIVEPGGGLDVLMALLKGVDSIEVLEENPIIIELMTEYEFSGGIYEDERVEVHISGVRGYLSRSERKYDLIQLSSREGFATSGMYALSENYNFTTEAFTEYIYHLSDDGVLVVGRYLNPPPREEVRMVALAISALEELDVGNPKAHIVVMRSWGTITLLLKKSEFTRKELEMIREFSRDLRFDLVHLQGMSSEEANLYNKFPKPYYYNLVHKLFEGESLEDYLFDLSPARDDKPFFFHFFSWSKLVPLYQSMGKKWQPFIEGGYLVPVILLQAIILGTVLILLPLKTLSKVAAVAFLPYFFFLGLGYMFCEITLIQRFILFLDHPVYAISVVLFSMLLSSGVGSFFSGRFRIRSLKKILLSICGLLLLYNLLISEIFNLFLSAKISSKYLISFITLFPLGFFMGMPFPMGLRLLKRNSIPWAWALNACASVLASVGAVVIALSYGFKFVFLLASISYLFALVFYFKKP
ncbi:MAG: hypothetical protein ACE5HW_01205 [Candidatus Methanofastidiosia archaeon]